MKLLKILLIFCFLSCSPEKRLYRLLKKYPQLTRHDTVFKMDTTIIYGTSFDTVFKNTITKDTLIIKDHQLSIKYYNDGKVIYLKGACDTIKVIKNIPVIFNTVAPGKEIRIMRWYDYIAYTIAAFALLFFGLYIYSRGRQ